MNGIEVVFHNIYYNNFECLHYRILNFFTVRVFREPDSSTHFPREYCSNSAIFFSRSTVILLMSFYGWNASLSYFIFSIWASITSNPFLPKLNAGRWILLMIWNQLSVTKITELLQQILCINGETNWRQDLWW